MADTAPSQDPRAAFEHRCKLIGIDGAALERWEEGCENPAMAGRYVRNHVRLMWRAYQWGMTSAEPQPNAAEPVAWIDDGTTGVNRNSEFRVVTSVTKQGMHASLAAKFSTPLYAAPQPNAALADGWKRKPLTLAQMEAGRESIFSTSNPFCPCDSKTFRKVAEWVERHHRIAAPPTLNASKEAGHA